MENIKMYYLYLATVGIIFTFVYLYFIEINKENIKRYNEILLLLEDAKDSGDVRIIYTKILSLNKRTWNKAWKGAIFRLLESLKEKTKNL